MDKNYFMELALKEAKKAYKRNEIPVGCIIVKDGKIISKAYNLKESKKSATSHAEILAINKACKKLKNWRLNDCKMYVTLEPCPMCMGAIISSRIKKLYIGTNDKIWGSCGSKLNMKDNFDSDIEVESGILEDECSKILKSFFKTLRERKN